MSESNGASNNGNGKPANEITELYRKYRPTLFKQMVGQEEAVAQLKEMVRARTVPHALLFTGSSGCGKTTAARILKGKLECGDADFSEINAADTRGIDTIREIKSRVTSTPISGKCRIWLLDEAHKLTDDAQASLLKVLEDTPSHVYFMLATTDPHKLKLTIRTRCTEIKFVPVPELILKELVTDIAGKESIDLTDDVAMRISEASENSPRKALVLLHQVAGLKTNEERLEAIVKSDVKRQAKDLCLALTNPAKKWADVAPILKGLEGEDPEQLRRMVLGWAKGTLLSNNRKAHSIAYEMITCFEGNFFDSGFPGLVRACYETMQRRG